MGVKHTAGSNAVNFLPAGMQNFVTFIDTRPKITAPSQHLGLPGGAAGARDGTGCPVDIYPILLVNLGCPRHEEKINVLVVTQLFTGLHIHSVTRRAISSVGQRQTASLRISHGMTRQHPAAVGRPDWVGEEPVVTRCTIREAGTCRFRLGLPIRPCGHTKIFWVRMSVSGRHLRVEPVYHPRWRREIVRRETVYWLKFSPLSLRRRVMCKQNASLPAHTQYVQADTTQRRLARGRHAGDSK